MKHQLALSRRAIGYHPGIRESLKDRVNVLCTPFKLEVRSIGFPHTYDNDDYRYYQVWA